MFCLAFLLSHEIFLSRQPKTLRLRCIGRLRNLVTMDDKVVTEEETALAIRMAACSRIAYVTILAHSRTDEAKPRTLSLESTTSVLMRVSKHKPVKLCEDDKKWFFKVCLSLNPFVSSIELWRFKALVKQIQHFTEQHTTLLAFALPCSVLLCSGWSNESNIPSNISRVL